MICVATIDTILEPRAAFSRLMNASVCGTLVSPRPVSSFLCGPGSSSFLHAGAEVLNILADQAPQRINLKINDEQRIQCRNQAKGR